MPTAWSNRRLVKPTRAHVATPTNFYFANEKLNLRAQDAVTSIRHRRPHHIATQLLCNVMKLCGEFRGAARSLKLSLDKPSDLQKRREKSQLFWGGPCSMSFYIWHLPFSHVFNIFIRLQARAVAVFKSIYSLYGVRTKLTTTVWQCILTLCHTGCSSNFSNPRAQLLLHLANIIANVAG